MDIVYPCKNTRKCYWLCGECLKGHSRRCSPKCADYLSVARAERIKREGDNAYQVEHGQG